jgi:hypothetical protein
MDQGPLVNEDIEVGTRFLAEFKKRFSIRIAFWLKNAETGNWRLYFSSDKINPETHRKAISVATRLVVAMNIPWFSIFKIGVLDHDDRLTQDVLKIQKQYSMTAPVRVGQRYVDFRDAEEIYIYPSEVPVPA